MNTERIIYFDNDVCNFVDEEMVRFKEDPLEWYLNSGTNLTGIVFDLMNYLKKNTLENKELDKSARTIISSMDTWLDFETDVELNKFAKLIKIISKDNKCFEMLCKNYEDELYRNYDYINDEMRFNRNIATEELDQAGFKPGKYIILGFNMGWRKRNGYKIVSITNVEDIENAVTGNYDYTIEISRPNKSAAYIEAKVATHDSLGENYIIIPVKRLKEALTDMTVKEEYEKYEDWIKLDLAELN